MNGFIYFEDSILNPPSEGDEKMKNDFELLKKSRRSFGWNALVSGVLVAGTLGTGTPAFASVVATPQFTYGTEISGYYAHGFVNYYNTYSTPGYDFSGMYGVSYTNQILSQTNIIYGHDLSYINGNYVANPPDGSYASSTASLSGNQLSMSLHSVPGGAGNQGTMVNATAEMWDTLTLGNLPSVSANTVIGTLSMTVNSAILNNINAGETYGFKLINPTSFVQYSTQDCGLTNNCSGVISGGSPSYSFGGARPPSTITYSLPVTLGDLTAGGQIGYISALMGNANSSGATITVDPSITLTGLYHGVTVTSLSGTNYVAAVPEPGEWALMTSGLGLMGFMVRRKKSA